MPRGLFRIKPALPTRPDPVYQTTSKQLSQVEVGMCELAWAIKHTLSDLVVWYLPWACIKMEISYSSWRMTSGGDRHPCIHAVLLAKAVIGLRFSAEASAKSSVYLLT